MPEIELKDTNNKGKGKVTLPDEIFGLQGRKDILHSSVVNYLANQRQGTHATKTKGLVSGAARNPGSRSIREGQGQEATVPRSGEEGVLCSGLSPGTILISCQKTSREGH